MGIFLTGGSKLQNNADRFFVITGGPGSGKSTLIEALHQLGYARSVEAGRAIIRDQVAIDGPALPGKNPALFAEFMLCWEMRNYHLAEASAGIVFFDRGVPDVLGYLRLKGLAIPTHLQNAAKNFRYNHGVFIAPPWQEIFEQDRERKQDFEEAARTYDSMVAIYTEYGYELIELPRASVEERVQYVLHTVTSLPR